MSPTAAPPRRSAARAAGRRASVTASRSRRGCTGTTSASCRISWATRVRRHDRRRVRQRHAGRGREFEGEHQRPVDGALDADDIATLRAAAAAGPATVAAPAVNTGPKATVGPDGLAVAPAGAPPQVVQIIAAGNQIASKPYKYGGGHGKWTDSGYDCSGSVSFALHGAGLLEQACRPAASRTGAIPGPGQWVRLRQRRPHVHGRRGPALRHERPQQPQHPLAGPSSVHRTATPSATRPGSDHPVARHRPRLRAGGRPTAGP